MARYHPDSISIYWLMMMMMVVVTGVALVASARLHFWLQLAGIFRIGLARVRLLCNVQWLHLATFWFMYQTQTTNRPPMHEHFNVISNMLSSVSWCAWWWTATTKTAAVAAHYTHQNICSCGRLIRSRRWHHSTKHAVHAKPAHKKKNISSNHQNIKCHILLKRKRIFTYSIESPTQSLWCFVYAGNIFVSAVCRVTRAISII